MITRTEAIKRLEEISREIAELTMALQEGLADGDPTAAFLEKCGGWEDDRSADEIIAEINAARTATNRAANIFDD